MAKRAQQYIYQQQAQWWQQNRAMVQKTMSYYAMHMSVAVVVAWAITGSWQMAVAISMVEPLVQAGAYFWHERWWTARGQTQAVTTACCAR